MPRDLEAYPEVQTRPEPVDERPDLRKPSLEGLAWLLRHLPTELPEWHWDFANIVHHSGPLCGTAGCAIGIARSIWKGKYFTFSFTPDNPRVGMTIFQDGADDTDITPSVVAGRIDDYLAGRPIRYLAEGDRSAAHGRRG